MQGEVSPMLDAPAFAEALLPCEVPDDPVLRSFLVSIQVHLAFLSRKNERTVNAVAHGRDTSCMHVFTIT